MVHTTGNPDSRSQRTQNRHIAEQITQPLNFKSRKVHIKEYQKEYQKEYYKRPEVREKHAKHFVTPETAQKIYKQRLEKRGILSPKLLERMHFYEEVLRIKGPKYLTQQERLKYLQKRYNQKKLVKNNRKYYLEHRGGLLAKSRLRYQNPEFKSQLSEYQKQYRQTNKSVLKTRSKEYSQRPEVKVRKREYIRNYYHTHLKNKPEFKSKKLTYLKEYHQRPEVKARYKLRRQYLKEHPS